MGNNKQVGKQVKGDMIQDSIVIKNTTYDELMKCLMAGDVQGAMKVMEMQEKALGVVHPNYPYYSLGIRRIGDNLVPYSKHLNKEAIEKYPPKIKGKFSFSDKYKNFKNISDILAYSYKTQTDIEINNIELMKMIGDEVDPYQGELNLLLSETIDWKIKPKAFPKAIPCKIVIEGSEINYDYVLLRTIRIEDNKVFLSNKEQGNSTEFNFIVDLKIKKINISIKFNQDIKATKQSLLKYLRFTKSILTKSKFSIISLELDTVLVEGFLNNYDLETSYANIDNEIIFLEYIMLIEDHYNRTIDIPEQIKEEDLEAVYYLGEALKYGEIKGSWKEETVNFIIEEEFIRNIKNLEDIPFDLGFNGSVKVVIFEKKFTIPKSIKIFENAQIKDLDKVKKKAEVLEDDDVIKVTFIPKGENEYTEKFDFKGEEIITQSTLL